MSVQGMEGEERVGEPKRGEESEVMGRWMRRGRDCKEREVGVGRGKMVWGGWVNEYGEGL